MIETRVPKIETASANPEAVKLWLMQCDLIRLIRKYNYKSEEIIQKIPFIRTDILKRLYQFYLWGDMTTVIAGLRTARIKQSVQ